MYGSSFAELVIRNGKPNIVVREIIYYVAIPEKEHVFTAEGNRLLCCSEWKYFVFVAQGIAPQQQ